MPTPFFVLDGGMGHILKLSQGAGDFLGGALAPESAIRDAHSSFVVAGCDVLTTANFGVTPRNLERRGSPAEDLEPITRRVARVAVRVAAEENERRGETRGGGRRRKVLVAGCLPPLGDNCYLPSRLALSEASGAHERIARCLVDEGVDVILAETVSCTADADAAAAAVGSVSPSSPSVPLWISFTVDDDEPLRLRGGEPLEEAALRALRGVDAETSLPRASAVLVNCCSPSACTAALPALRRAIARCPPSDGALFGCYANGFRDTTSSWLRKGGFSLDDGGGGAPAPASRRPAVTERDDNDDGDYDARGMITPEAYARHAKAWASACRAGGRGGEGGKGDDAAVTEGSPSSLRIVVGGCCGVGPAHIEAVRRALVDPEEDEEAEGAE